MDRSSAGGLPGGSSEARRPSGRIPISTLIDPTDAVDARAPPTPTYAPRTPSSATSSPTFYHPRRTSVPMAFLTNPASPEAAMNARRTGDRPPADDGSEADSTSFERQDSAWASSSDVTRKPRAPRPSYSEEQKFFIMFARIVRDLSWPEIEDQFAEIFGQRSKGGLTSVYYRVRKDWGIMEVLKSGPGSFVSDCGEVEKHAQNFSAEFLDQIGYFER